MTAGAPIVLEVRDLEVAVRVGRGILPIVRGVSFTIARGETLGVVGESGSGKTVTAQSIMRLLPVPPFRLTAGRLALDGRDVLAASPAELRQWRGRDMAMVFQDPMTALNPLFTIGDQIAEALLCHGLAGRAEAYRRAVALLKSVGVPDPALRAGSYPFQFSGGMRQRAVIATAIACGPKLLIADEPTTALDVTVQAQIFDLLASIQRETKTAILLISHDLATISRIADRTMVMYGGRKMEEAPTRRLVRAPRHPYTQALLRCAPHLRSGAESLAELPELPGTAPSGAELARLGCPFVTRCPHAMPRCRAEMPPSVIVEDGHEVACWLAVGGDAVPAEGARAGAA